MRLGRRNPSDSRLSRGLSLIELMIGLAVGSLIVAGALTVFAKISFSGLENVRMVRLNEQLRGTLDLMRRDIQRAGYVEAWQGGDTTVDDLDTTAMGLFGIIEVNAAGDCITYSYDYVKDAAQATNEIFGFRLVGTEIRRKTTSAACTEGEADWPSPITDSEVVIDILSFERDLGATPIEVDDGVGDGDGVCDAGENCTSFVVLNSDGDSLCETGETCLTRRKINVVLEGSLAADSDVTVRIQDEIKVKNDRYFTMP